MPEISSRSRPAAAAEPSVPAGRENRIDPPHLLANGRDEDPQTPAALGPANAASDAEAEVASLAMVQQLRLQAQQLSEHLGQQQADLNRREAELQAHAARLEQQERNNRLWLKCQHEELADRDAALKTREEELQQRASHIEQLEQNIAAVRRSGEEELEARRAALDRRESASRKIDEQTRERLLEVQAAAAALRDASLAHDELVGDLERRVNDFDTRRGITLEMLARFLAGEAVRPARPKHFSRSEAVEYIASQQRGPNGPAGVALPRDGHALADEFDQLANLLAELQSRRKHITEAEALLERAQNEVAELHQALLAERKQFEAERQGERQRHAELRRRSEADLQRRREALEAASQQLEVRRAAVDQMRAELTVVQREALENRLAAEELLAQLAGAIPPAQLSHQIARSRARLGDCYRLQQEDVANQRRQLETLAAQITEQHGRLASQKRELEQWLRERTAECEADAARLVRREGQIDRQRDLVEKQRFDWEHERQEYQHQIRRLLTELGR
jgi:chromosome segregation ATPase